MRTCRSLLVGLLALTLTLATGCQDSDPSVVRVTATPDVPATVSALAQEPTATPVPTPTPAPTPNIEATVEVRLAATMAARPTDTPVPTPTPQPTDTPTPTPTLTPTPTPTPTATPTTVPTATPTPRPTNTPRPTLTPTPLPPLKYDRSLLLFGPESGSLVHDPEDGFLEAFDGPDTRDDVLVEATFLNPYSTSRKFWEHGFLLKDRGRNHQYWVSINADGYWRYFYRLGDTDALGEFSLKTVDINRDPGGRNLLQVVITGDRGWVYVNGKFQGGMDLSVDTGGDGITIIVDDEHPGETSYKDFTVWKWSAGVAKAFVEVDPNATPTPVPTPNPKVPVFGPVSGSILHDSEDGFLAVYRKGPGLSKATLCWRLPFEVPICPE